MKKSFLTLAAVLAVGAGVSWAGSSDSEFASRLGALQVASPAKALAAARKGQPDAGLIVPSVGAPLTQLPPDALARLKSKAEEMYREYGTNVETEQGRLFTTDMDFFQVQGDSLPNGAFNITSVNLAYSSGFAKDVKFIFNISMNGKIIKDAKGAHSGGLPLEHPLSQKALKQVLENYIGSVQ